MRGLSEAEFWTELVPLIVRLFRPDRVGYLPATAYAVDDEEQPFTDALTSRLVIPIAVQFSDEDLRAITAAARTVGDLWLYYYRPGEPVQSGFPAAPYGAYAFPIDAPAAVEEFVAWYNRHFSPGNLLLSPLGKWAALSSEQNHGVLSGSDAFIAAFSRALGTTPQELLQRYLQDYEVTAWRQGYWARWVPALLAHICGPEQAARLLAALPPLPREW